MAEIVDIGRIRDKKVDDINSLIKRAYAICKKRLLFSKGSVEVIREDQIKSIFESRITEEIFARKEINSDIFLCGSYVSNLLAEMVRNGPESWWAIDYACSSDSSVLKKGETPVL